MPLWTCEQCGAQFPDSAAPPASCLICEDERQFVNWKGQTWLSREQFCASHRLARRDDLTPTHAMRAFRATLLSFLAVLSAGDGFSGDVQVLRPPTE